MGLVYFFIFFFFLLLLWNDVAALWSVLRRCFDFDSVVVVDVPVVDNDDINISEFIDSVGFALVVLWMRGIPLDGNDEDAVALDRNIRGMVLLLLLLLLLLLEVVVIVDVVLQASWSVATKPHRPRRGRTSGRCGGVPVVASRPGTGQQQPH